jgi:hypothetical protein
VGNRGIQTQGYHEERARETGSRTRWQKSRGSSYLDLPLSVVSPVRFYQNIAASFRPGPLRAVGVPPLLVAGAHLGEEARVEGRLHAAEA